MRKVIKRDIPREGKNPSWINSKKNKDEEAELYAKRKQEEAWHEIINNKFQNIM